MAASFYIYYIKFFHIRRLYTMKSYYLSALTAAMISSWIFTGTCS